MFYNETLNQRHQKIINELKNLSWYSKNPIAQTIRIEFEKMFEWQDPDYEALLYDDLASQMVELLTDCYNEKEFLEWFMVKMQGDLLKDYRYADRYHEEDGDNMEECKYNGEWDCLLYNDSTPGKATACRSW